MTTATVLQEVGESLPPDTPHAVSVSLPTWKSCVGYEEGEQWVLSKMKCGYPRFFIDPVITRFAEAIVKKHASPTEKALLLPSHATASTCVDFFQRQMPSLREAKDLKTISLYPYQGPFEEAMRQCGQDTKPLIVAVIFPQSHFKIAKTFWQHTGEGVSSRRAEICHKAFENEQLITSSPAIPSPLNGLSQVFKGPQRYRRQTDAKPVGTGQSNHSPVPRDQTQFVEERFGRNLDIKLAANAKLAIRRRIAGALTPDLALGDKGEAGKTDEEAGEGRGVEGFSVDDVYLYPSGMSSIFNTHSTMMKCRGRLQSICFGFPYIDTLKVLEKWGPGCVFYGHGSSEDMDNIESRCDGGERFLALFCEFPGNPLLKTPDISRLRSLADRYDFAIVIDETIGNFLNVHVLRYADVVVSSLTKVFSGDSNVMGGSAILNPQGPYYGDLKRTLYEDYQDNYWLEDAIFMERNSRDFDSRRNRINQSAEAICQTLKASPLVREVYYPKYSPTRHFYDQCRTKNGGYGGLLSVTFNSQLDAIIFFDALETAKGPSLGTNFTLSCPFVLLAHYGELEWAAQFGAEADLIRSSVGLEDTTDLCARYQRALDAVSAYSSKIA